jgi:hypothetical protein
MRALPASPAPGNVYPVKCEAYLSGAEPIALGRSVFHRGAKKKNQLYLTMVIMQKLGTGDIISKDKHFERVGWDCCPILSLMVRAPGLVDLNIQSVIR